MTDLMFQAVRATYEGDILRLHQSLPLDEWQGVWVIVVSAGESLSFTRKTPSPDEILDLAAQVYEGLSEDEVDEIEHFVLDRSRFFAGRD